METEIEYDEILALPVWAKEQVIPTIGLYGKVFTIVKLIDDKYILYRGEKQTQRNFIGIFNNLDDTYTAINARCKKEKANEEKQAKLEV